MKRYLIFLAATFCAVTSCSKEEILKTDEVKLVPATIVAKSSDFGTKTIATLNGEVYNIKWEEGDALSVFNEVDIVNRKFTANQTDKLATFTGELPETAKNIYPIMPYDKDAHIDGTTVYTSVPAEQDGDFYNVVLAGWPKSGTKAEEDFLYQFEAVSGIIKFHFDPAKFTSKLAEGEKIVSVKLVADRPIVGDAQISYAGKKPVMTAGTKNVSNTVSILMPDGLTEGDYYIATFPILTSEVGTMGLSVSIETNYGNTASVRQSLPGSGKTEIFTANIVKNIGTINFKEFDPRPFTSGEFTSSANRLWVTGKGNVWSFTKISFSRGNLQYQGSTNKWRFALNQWDVQGDVGNSTLPEVNEFGNYVSEGPRATQSDWIDLFPWGHTNWNDGSRTYEPSQCTSIEDKFYYKHYPSKALNGTPGDWGYQNAIMNGDTEDPAGTWRLFKKAELYYILDERGKENDKQNYNCPDYMPTQTFTIPEYVKVNVHTKTAKLRFLRCGIRNAGTVQYGLLIFPDGFIWPSGLDAPIRIISGSSNGSLAFNDHNIADSEAPVYDMSIFSSKLAGCVFLPSAGYRESFTPGSLTSLCPKDLNKGGKYWSQSIMGSGEHLAIYSQNISWENRSGWVGASVRLVKDVPAATAEHEGVENDGDYNF